MFLRACGLTSGAHPNLSFGVLGGSHGTIWFDDIQVEETSLVYVLRRDGTPLKIYDPNDPSKVYEEGKDVNPIRDPNLAAGRGFQDQYHKPVTVKLPASTRLAADQTVAMDYYVVEPVAPAGDVGACLTEPGVQNWLLNNARAVTAALGSATGYLLSYDEMRHMNSCASCKAKNLTAGKLLAWHVANTYQLYHSLAPDAPIYFWNDMFDPYHNAHDHYYRVEGDIAESWTGLPPQTTIMNWNYPDWTNSLKWFAGMDPRQPTPFRQIIAGYYDSGDGAAAAAQEIQAAMGIPGIAGLMYTTWADDRAQLQPFADAVKKNWGAYLASLPENARGK
jgi:hypothetical protein